MKSVFRETFAHVWRWQTKFIYEYISIENAVAVDEQRQHLFRIRNERTYFSLAPKVIIKCSAIIEERWYQE